MYLVLMAEAEEADEDEEGKGVTDDGEQALPGGGFLDDPNRVRWRDEVKRRFIRR